MLAPRLHFVSKSVSFIIFLCLFFFALEVASECRFDVGGYKFNLDALQDELATYASCSSSID